MTLNKFVLALTLVASPIVVAAQQKHDAQKVTLRNEDVIQMTRLGLSSPVIIARIRNSPSSFDLSTSGLVAMTRAKVADAVIQAMISGTADDTKVEQAAGVTITPDRAKPEPKGQGAVTVPMEPGLYMYAEVDGVKKMIELEPTVYTQAKTGGMLKRMLTYGIAKSTVKAVIRGREAVIRTPDSLPIFYFVFSESSKQGPGAQLFTGASSPNEFTLLRLDVTDAGRETTIAASNNYGSESGTNDSVNQPFAFTKIRAGAYRVVPREALENGEYCFLSSISLGGAPGAGAATKLFDFSVVPPSRP